MESIPSYNYCIVLCDTTLNDWECRFELPNAGWFETYSRGQKYVLLSVSKCWPLEKRMSIRAEVKAYAKMPIIYVSPKVFSGYGFDVGGDIVSVLGL